MITTYLSWYQSATLSNNIEGLKWDNKNKPYFFA